MRRSSSRAVFVLSIAFGSSLVARDADAQDAGAKAESRSKVVAHVGDRVITLGEVQDRIDAVPRFQLALFGKTPAEIRKRFVEEVVIRDVVYVEAAKKKGIERNPHESAALRKAEAESTVRNIEKGLPPVTKEEVLAFYEAHRADYEGKERVNLRRIVCRSREEAESVLAEAKKAGTEKKFVELAEAHSVDDSTRLRGGNLGFVAIDGSSEPKIEPAVLKAVSEVEDGEFVSKPIEVGKNFAVVWRRGHVPAQTRKFEDLEPQLRGLVAEQRRLRVVRERTEELRSKWLTEEHPEYLDSLELPIFDAGLAVRNVARAAVAAARSASRLDFPVPVPSTLSSTTTSTVKTGSRVPPSIEVVR